jgi:long-chain acyl-CoA synthetase
MVVADNRKYVTALIFPDFDYVEELKKGTGREDSSTADFLHGGEVEEKIQACIDELNTHLHHTEEVQKFAVIGEQPAVESGELTPTMKIKRSVIEEKYRSVIDGLYDARE